MNWSYIAGYFDGEGSLLIGVYQDKRSKRNNSMVDKWTIYPSLSLTTFDYEVLKAIKTFIEDEGFKVSSLETKTRRKGQTNRAMRVSIFGWDNINDVLDKLIPLSIAKQAQFLLFRNLYRAWESRIIRNKGYYHHPMWTKETFLEAMGIIDNINSFKCRNRGKMNRLFFERLWGNTNGS